MTHQSTADRYASVLKTMSEYRTALSKWNNEKIKHGSASVEDRIITHVQRLYDNLCAEYPQISFHSKNGFITRSAPDKKIKIMSSSQYELANLEIMSGAASQQISLYPLKNQNDIICVTYYQENDHYVCLNIQTYGNGFIGNDVTNKYKSNRNISLYSDVLTEISLKSRSVECYFYIDYEQDQLHFLYCNSFIKSENMKCVTSLRSRYYNSRQNNQNSYKKVITKGKPELTNMMRHKKASRFLVNYESLGDISISIIPNWLIGFELFKVVGSEYITDVRGEIVKTYKLKSVDNSETLIYTVPTCKLIKSFSPSPNDFVVYRPGYYPEIINPNPDMPRTPPVLTCPSCSSILSNNTCTDKIRCPQTNMRRIEAFLNKFSLGFDKQKVAKKLYSSGLKNVTSILTKKSSHGIFKNIFSVNELSNFIKFLDITQSKGIRYSKLLDIHDYVCTSIETYKLLPMLYSTFDNFINNIEVLKHGIDKNVLESVRRERQNIINDHATYSSIMSIASTIKIN